MGGPVAAVRKAPDSILFRMVAFGRAETGDTPWMADLDLDVFDCDVFVFGDEFAIVFLGY